MKDRVALALIAILVLLAGGTIGFALGTRYRAANPVSLSDSGTMASADRLYSTDAIYENSLRAYVALLDDLSARDASDSTRQTYASDKALSLIRLADLAEKRGSSARTTNRAAPDMTRSSVLARTS